MGSASDAAHNTPYVVHQGRVISSPSPDVFYWHGLLPKRMFIGIEDIILRCGCDAIGIEEVQDLGAMIGAMVDDMQQYLPDDQITILGRLANRGTEQILIAEAVQITSNQLLSTISVCPDDRLIEGIVGECCRWFDSLEFAEPDLIDIDQVHDLVAH